MTAVSTEIPQRRELVTELPGPRSRELAERRSAAVAAGVGSVMPVYVARAGGGIVEDVDGNRLIDLGSGIAVTSVGSAAPRVVEGVRQQVGESTHTCFMVTPYEGYVDVCEKLAEVTPGDHAKKSALFNSGAEAVENAVKIARYATGRQAVVAVDHAYHGRTNLTMALTAKAMPYKKGFGPFASDVYRVPTSYPFRDPEGMTGEQAAQRAILAADKAIGADQIAAVIIEPIQGEGGFIVPAPGFLSALAAWCKDNGIVFIADEVQSGFCRTGAWFASDHEDVVPDLVTTAKGIAGGLPLAAVTGRAELMDAVHGGGLGGTYGGNPVACAAALGAIETMEAEDLAGRAREIETIIGDRLRELQATNPAIGDVRGRGAMMAVEVVKPGTKEPDAELTAAAAKRCHEQGVIALTCGTYGNVLRLLPPLVISDDLLREGLDVLADALSPKG
ncbi:4-aminobutyrate aminotransferase/(S)-3-amino-2-methylpropionate transaminase [Barrientosiimonas humi]|uniref:4-aminobutyrate aminotransferase n=2 Tax=Barrientosiimonas TaxID=1535207 RepID=A0A542X9B5_9MICO|nr:MULTISPECIES: 4-aminobutyrate--2-oxoglutarate transaminase [Barrientosiimonas]TQL32419.1 4-aminobutyrate aminotransferase/(S)-3-amino-2-methylpropionate transaminase [Barrientosiimonas humi]BDZ57176.1 aspartate aminotransferase family protein [Barrientosiimonas endolithica]CAG7572410.1 4-aminobutyrate aminotransferase [Barrientosiimonas humi]